MTPRQAPPRVDTYIRLLAAILITLVLAILLGSDFSSSAQGQVQVNAADPPTAEQGTVSLNVRVTGKGFKNGAQAKWFVTGTTNPGGVTVNSTTFVSSTELTANITVDDAAAIANFDIQVLNSDGRGGKGTELFNVIQKGGNTSCSPQATTPCVTGSGCLDQSFNVIGQVLTNTSGNVPSVSDMDTASAVMAQSDGKLVVVGRTSNPSGDPNRFDVLAIRYESNGTLDTSSFGDLDAFGNRTGITRVSLQNYETIRNGGGTLYTDSNGVDKILAVGYTRTTSAGIPVMFVVRLNSDGSLDPTFGDIDPGTFSRTGKKLIQIGGGNTQAWNVVVRVVDGTTTMFLGGHADGQGVVFKMQDNGDLDPSYNGTGYVTLGHGPMGLALQPDGKVIAGGWLGNPKKPDTNNFVVTRLTTTGQLDTAFGVNGRITTDFFGYADHLQSLTLDSAGRIIATGQVKTSQNSESVPAVARYTSSGQLEVKNTMSYTSSGMKDVIVQPDGKILVIGAIVDCEWGFAITRFNGTDLSLDTSFGDSGTVVSQFAESGCISANPTSLTIQIDPACMCPKIVAAGSADTTQGYSVALLRLVP